VCKQHHDGSENSLLVTTFYIEWYSTTLYKLQLVRLSVSTKLPSRRTDCDQFPFTVLSNICRQSRPTGLAHAYDCKHHYLKGSKTNDNWLNKGVATSKTSQTTFTFLKTWCSTDLLIGVQGDGRSEGQNGDIRWRSGCAGGSRQLHTSTGPRRCQPRLLTTTVT
jgi:hypothetical protein